MVTNCKMKEEMDILEHGESQSEHTEMWYSVTLVQHIGGTFHLVFFVTFGHSVQLYQNGM